MCETNKILVTDTDTRPQISLLSPHVVLTLRSRSYFPDTC